MSEEYRPDLYSLTDEDGKEQMFELLDSMEYEGETYYALTPYYEDGDEALQDDGAVVILKSEYEGDDEDDAIKNNIDKNKNLVSSFWILCVHLYFYNMTVY